ISIKRSLYLAKFVAVTSGALSHFWGRSGRRRTACRLDHIQKFRQLRLRCPCAQNDCDLCRLVPSTRSPEEVSSETSHRNDRRSQNATRLTPLSPPDHRGVSAPGSSYGRAR